MKHLTASTMLVDRAFLPIIMFIIVNKTQTHTHNSHSYVHTENIQLNSNIQIFSLATIVFALALLLRCFCVAFFTLLLLLLWFFHSTQLPDVHCKLFELYKTRTLTVKKHGQLFAPCSVAVVVRMGCSCEQSTYNFPRTGFSFHRQWLIPQIKFGCSCWPSIHIEYSPRRLTNMFLL